MRIGESRHKAKNEVREERKAQGKDLSAVNIRVDTIHSMNTYKTYLEHCTHFVEWCIQEKGVNKYASLNKIEKYAKEYLQYREEQGKSLYTLKAEKAALGKLYSKEIDYKFKEARTVDKITRSRNETERQKHFSEEKNRDLVNIAKATGGRRADLEKLTRKDFFADSKGNLWVSFQGSKGGRDRVAPVLPQYKDAVKEFISTKDNEEHLFDKIHNAADIHAYRREYAQSLYSLVADDKEKAQEYALNYPVRDKTGYDTYYARGDKKTAFRGLKDNIYIVSQALGHNRLSVTVNHYLK
ncbi:hypothetical protein AALB47_12180 [Lachnospiraceae bacterium 54-11]